MPVARIEIKVESNGTWYVAIDKATGHEITSTRYGRDYLVERLTAMGYTVHPESTIPRWYDQAARESTRRDD